MIITRPCPACREAALQPVHGSDGKMGRCPKCGWTGPLLGPVGHRWGRIIVHVGKVLDEYPDEREAGDLLRAALSGENES